MADWTAAKANAEARKRFGPKGWARKNKPVDHAWCNREKKAIPLTGLPSGGEGPTEKCCASAQHWAAFHNANLVEAGDVYTLPGLGTGLSIKLHGCGSTFREAFALHDKREAARKAEIEAKYAEARHGR